MENSEDKEVFYIFDERMADFHLHFTENTVSINDLNQY